jgi:hypothetical protein
MIFTTDAQRITDGLGTVPDEFEDRVGGCLDLNAEALLQATVPEEWRLVHGSIQGMGEPRIAHAWLIHLPSGLIVDNVIQPHTGLPPQMYRLGFNAIPYAMYDQDTLETLMDLHDDYGPYHLVPFGRQWYDELAELAGVET